MSKFCLFFSILLFNTTLLVAQKATDDFSGRWITEENKPVDITKNGTVFTGLLILKNKIVMENVSFIDGKWLGTMIRPKDDAKADCEVLLEGNKLKITIKKGIARKTIVWKRG